MAVAPIGRLDARQVIDLKPGDVVKTGNRTGTVQFVDVSGPDPVIHLILPVGRISRQIQIHHDETVRKVSHGLLAVNRLTDEMAFNPSRPRYSARNKGNLSLRV